MLYTEYAYWCHKILILYKKVYLPFTVTVGLHLTNNPGLPESTFDTM